MPENINFASIGLNTDNLPSQQEKGSITFALNSQIESFSNGQRVAYQNEASNKLCTEFPDGLIPIGIFYISHIDRSIFFLSDDKENHCIAYTENGNCDLKIVISSPCLNFSFKSPIHQIVAKITNCSVQIFWTDDLNARRFLDFENLPFREITDPNNDFKKIKILNDVDCNKLLIQPSFSIPKPEIISVEEGGLLKEGSYQFIVQYANIEGEGYSPFYNATDTISIHDPKKVTENFDTPTSKALRVKVTGLDNSGLFDAFNLVVIETINAIETPRLVGTFPISTSEYTTLYTGRTSTTIQFTTQELFQKYAYYDIAGGLTTSDDRVIWYDLKEKQRINYLDIWTKVKAHWVSYKIPYNEQEGYYNPENTNKYKGYLRDEVYPFEGVFLLRNGKQTDRFPLRGREATSYDLEIINNLDAQTIDGTACDPLTLGKPRWQVYNTGSVIETYPDTGDLCYKGKYQRGEFAYWESELTYPKNPLVYKSLSGQKILHFKFPDELITPRYSTEDNHDFIYPIGVEIDRNSLLEAIAQSDLSREEQDEIIGFKIVRGDRIGNQSIIAKGLLHNVGKTTHNDQEFYYPNYPFNDVRPDPFFVKDKGIEDHSGFRPDRSIVGFDKDDVSRFTFHSPDTHFAQPFGIDTGYLKMETIEYGTSKGHFVPIKDNAEYKFLSQSINRASVGIAAAGGFTLAAGTFGWPTFSVDRIIPTFINAQEMFEKLAPFTNFGYSHNSVGEYTKSYPIPNEGFKTRGIDYGRYLLAGNYRVEDGNIINNTLRESSVYLHTNKDFKFTHDYDPIIPEDKSRYTLSSHEGLETMEQFINDYIVDHSLITDDDIRLVMGVQQTLQNLGEVWDFTIDPLTGDKPNIGDVYTSGGLVFEVQSCNTVKLTAIKTGTGTATGTLTLQSQEDPDATPASTITYSTFTIEQPITDPDSEIPTIRDIINSITSITDYDNLFGGSAFDELAAGAFQIAYFRVLNLDNIVPEAFKYSDISGYYGAIKRNVPAQWGEIRSYQVVDTGYYQNLSDDEYETVFGGDTFINRMALKIKLQMFDNTTVLRPDSSDINYKKLGVLGYPMFWVSTEPEDFKLDIQEYIDKIIKVVNSAPGVDDSGTVLSKIWSVIKGILSGGAANVAPVMGAMINIFLQIYKKLGKKNVNLDAAKVDGYIEKGLMYIYSYGIPTFFVESQVNVDYRQAINETWGEFYPHVSSGIPDLWLQEAVTPIIHDNNYTYNQSFSKQNRENYYSFLPEDYDPNKTCIFEQPNRAIWSDKTNLNETLNNWLIYRPLNKFDFPKTFGKLTSLDGIKNKLVLARFENQTQLYNAITTLDSSTQSVYLGNDKLFSAPPIDLSQTDTGALGSQNKWLSNNEHGIVFTDALRGQVVMIRGQQPELLSDKKMVRFFKQNLPFKIKNHFPSIDTDNHFTGVGLHGVYDSFYQRLIITKLDYEPKKDINLIDGKFYFQDREVALEDEEYFYNRSFTISYNFLIEAWVSFHSYCPNTYIPNINYFTSVKGSTTWNHNQRFDSFCNFYDKDEEYVLEYPYATKTEEIIQSITDYCTSLKYTSFESYTRPEETLYYNKCIIYNDSQNTGLLNLIPKPANDPFATLKFPKYNIDSKDILVSKGDNLMTFNKFWNIVKSTNVSNWTEKDLINKELNNANLDYGMMNYKKALIRGRDNKVRLILDNDHSYKIISQFIIEETKESKL